MQRPSVVITFGGFRGGHFLQQPESAIEVSSNASSIAPSGQLLCSRVESVSGNSKGRPFPRKLIGDFFDGMVSLLNSSFVSVIISPCLGEILRSLYELMQVRSIVRGHFGQIYAEGDDTDDPGSNAAP